MSTTARCMAVLMATVCLSFAQNASAAASEARALSATAREVKASTTEAQDTRRQLYVDPNAKPSSTVGWNVIVSIICQGKFTTVNTIKLRTAIQTLGFPTNGQNFQFGGNAATTNWRSITTFVINIAKATSADDAVQAVKQKITKAALNNIANLPKANPVVDIIFTPFKA